jgi:hypothetical protein
MPSKRSRKTLNRSPRHDQRPQGAALSAAVRNLIATDLAGWAAIFLAVLISYTPAIHGTRLWDDAAHITRPDLQSVHGLWRIWFQLGATQQYYPLLHSAFWFEHRLWGDALIGYHLVNIALHALSACLVVAIVRRLELPGAWLSGFLFALHPVCTEVVAWISEQKSTLSTAFYLAAGLIYLSFDRTRRTGSYWSALLLFVLALLSKSVTATLPAAILLILWFLRGGLSWKCDALPLLPWVAIGAASGLFTAYVENAYIGAHGAAFSLTTGQRLLLAGRAAWFYFLKLVFPSDLIFVYPRWTISPSVWWQVFVSGGRHYFRRGLARVVVAQSRTTDSLPVFHRNPIPRSRLFQRLPFSVLLGRGSFSIPRDSWHSGADRMDCKLVPVAINPVESSDGRGSGIVVPHIGRVDLASERFL